MVFSQKWKLLFTINWQSENKYLTSSSVLLFLLWFYLFSAPSIVSLFNRWLEKRLLRLSGWEAIQSAHRRLSPLFLLNLLRSSYILKLPCHSRNKHTCTHAHLELKTDKCWQVKRKEDWWQSLWSLENCWKDTKSSRQGGRLTALVAMISISAAAAAQYEGSGWTVLSLFSSQMKALSLAV